MSRRECETCKGPCQVPGVSSRCIVPPVLSNLLASSGTSTVMVFWDRVALALDDLDATVL